MRAEDGHLGLVHDQAEKGDVICVFYGCSMPVILLRKEKTEEDMAKERAGDAKDLQRKVEGAGKWVLKAYRREDYAVRISC
jgi:hypothetical protein